MIKLITHTDLDGIGCAILAKLAFKDNVEIEYCNNPDGATEALNKLKAYLYDSIIVTDISFSPDKLSHNVLDRIQIFDHHATAMHCAEYGVVDTSGKECGTSLFYKFINNIDNAKVFVETVRKYDTWEWTKDGNKLPYYLNALLYLYGRDKFVDIFVDRLQKTKLTEINMFTTEEAFLIAETELQKERALMDASSTIHIVETYEHKIGVIFGSYDISSLALVIEKKFPDLDYVMQINLNTGAVSVRTDKSYIDLGKLMHDKYAGGGHKLSAGGKIENLQAVIESAIGQHIKSIKKAGK